MPYIAYLTFSTLLVILFGLTWLSNKMGENSVTALLLIATGADLTIIILAKCGVDLR